MATNAPLGRLVSRIAGAIHPRMNSLDERATRVLFNALTKSFESRLDEIHPGPQAQVLPSSSPFSLANRHFDNITSHPLFTSSAQADALRRSLDAQIAKLAGSAQSAYQDVLEKSKLGTLDDKAVRRDLKHMLSSSSSNSRDSTALLHQFLNHLHANHPALLVSLLEDKTLSKRLLQAIARSPNNESIWAIFTDSSNAQLQRISPLLFSRYLAICLRFQDTWFALQQIERALSFCSWMSTERANGPLLHLATHVLRNPASAQSLLNSPIAQTSADTSKPPLRLSSYLNEDVSASAGASFLSAALRLVNQSAPDPSLALIQIQYLKNNSHLLQQTKIKRNLQFPYVHLCLKSVELLVKQERYLEAEEVLQFAGREFPIFGQSPAENDTAPTSTLAATSGEYKLAVIQLCLTFVEQLISKRHYLEAQRIMLFAREKFPDILDGLTATASDGSEKGAMSVLEGILPL
jgi:hypothetical protein